MSEILYAAVSFHNEDEVESVLRDNPGLDVNWVSGKDDWTALHFAANRGDDDIVKMLLAHPDIDVNAADYRGRPPISLACEEGELSVVKLLLEDARVDAALEDYGNRSPLW